mmetsp:Transcript_11363/g.10286  ORF Transcript_11363/g.10286 Transcript_11363/m.10286 type:complete len:503 (-) Transcript_11363:559-2067(-)
MSKKGKKVDTSLFFNSNSTGISDIPNNNNNNYNNSDDRFNNRRYDRNSERPPQRRYDQQDRSGNERNYERNTVSSTNEGEGNWRRSATSTGSSTTGSSNYQNSVIPTRRVTNNISDTPSNPDDKWGSIFSNRSQSSSSWASKSNNITNSATSSSTAGVIVNDSKSETQIQNSKSSSEPEETNSQNVTDVDNIKPVPNPPVSTERPYQPPVNRSKFQSNADLQPNNDADKWSSVFSNSKFSRPSTNNKYDNKPSPYPQSQSSSNQPISTNKPAASTVLNKFDNVEDETNKTDSKELIFDKKKAMKAEAAKKSKEAKESLALKALQEKKRLEEIEDQSIVLVKAILETGLTGEELVNHLKTLDKKPSGSSLLKQILLSSDDPLSIKWCSKSEYGLALKYLLQGNDKAQVLAIYSIQLHCHKLKFPKIEIKETKRNLIEIIFQLCYQNDVIETSGFLSWSDDDADVDGKTDALFQVNQFMQILTDVDSEEEEEEEDIDAPLPTVP